MKTAATPVGAVSVAARRSVCAWEPLSPAAHPAGTPTTNGEVRPTDEPHAGPTDHTSAPTNVAHSDAQRHATTRPPTRYPPATGSAPVWHS